MAEIATGGESAFGLSRPPGNQSARNPVRPEPSLPGVRPPMKKVDVWPLLTAESQQAALKSQELHAAMNDLPSHPVAAARLGYQRERRHWNAFPAEVAKVEDLAFDTGHPGVVPAETSGRVKLRLYHPAPESRRPLVIYLHGGGYILGDLDTHDRIMRLIARESGWAVLGVDYTLAPEAKFPTQTMQITAVAENLAAILEGRSVDSARFAFAGDSAGANLSLSTTLELRERGGQLPVGLLLYYGGFGLKDSASRRLYGNRWDGLQEREMEAYQTAYCRRPEDRDDPRYNCLKADLAGLPPCFVAFAPLDPLRDDSLALAEGLALDGVRCELKRYEGVLHGFLHYSGVEPKALQAIRDGAAFLATL